MRTTRISNIKHYQLAPWPCKDPAVFEKAYTDLLKRDVIFLPEHLEMQAKPFLGDRITPAGLKAVKPSLKIYRWYDLAVKATWDSGWQDGSTGVDGQWPLRQLIEWRLIEANNWWLRDQGGDRIAHSNDPSRWLIDFGKPGCVDTYCANLKKRVDDPSVDGVMFDYPVYDLPELVRSWYGGQKTLRDYPEQMDWFERAWKPIVNGVSDTLHSLGKKYIILEGGDYKSKRPEHIFNRSKCDGIFYERGLANWWWVHHGDTYETANKYTTAQLAAKINGLYRDPLDVHWSESFPDSYKLEGGEADAERYRFAGFCFYLIAMKSPKAANRSYHFSSNTDDYSAKWWDPMDLYIGTPLRKGKKIDDAGMVWSREYTKAHVVMNYGVEPFLASVNRLTDAVTGEKFETWARVPPFSGRILLKD